MCLYIETEEKVRRMLNKEPFSTYRLMINSKPLVATEPIKVYKLLKRNYIGWKTPYQGQSVNFSFGKAEMGDGIMIGDLLDHRLNYLEHVKWENGEIKENEKNIYYASGRIYEGIHAYYSNRELLDESDLPKEFRVFEAVIPKGAHYFIGNCGDIVADRMIVYKNGVKDKTIKTIG